MEATSLRIAAVLTDHVGYEGHGFKVSGVDLLFVVQGEASVEFSSNELNERIFPVLLGCI